MNNRRFGVEIEFSGGGAERSEILDTLRRAFDRKGLRRWMFDNRLDYDGSEFELRTPVLRGENGFKALKVTMESLTSAGCYTTEEDGLHVHHDAPEFIDNMDRCIRLVKSWQANKHLIYQFVQQYRTVDDYRGSDHGYWACPQWTNAEVDHMEKTGTIPTWDRKELNLLSLKRHGSIEIRLHEGTLYYPEAESWIQFGQNFIDRTLKHEMRDSGETRKLLKKVRVSKDAEQVLIDKANWR